MAIPCLPLKQVTDGPLFGTEPGTLSALNNMRLVGTYAEARGGFDKLKPSGGTTSDAISAGGYATIQQVPSNFGMMRGDRAGTFTNNLQMYAGWYPFDAVPAVANAWYNGSDAPFSRVTFFLGNGLAAPGDMTFAFEYWNGSAWTSFTMEEVPTFLSSFGVSHMSWRMPTNWATTTVGDVATGRMLKYWMRVRIVTAPTPTNIKFLWAQGNWIGQSELYAASHSPITGGANGRLLRYDQNGTAAEWFQVSNTLFSGAASPPRTAAYKGRVFIVNGKEMKKWDGFSLTDIGFPILTATLATNGPGGAAGIGAGIWRYYVAWGFGPILNQDFSGPIAVREDITTLYGIGQVKLSTPATGADPADASSSLTTGANGINTITITGTIPTEATAAVIFRTRDLTNVPVGKRSEHPAFRVGTLWRTNEGTNPATALINLGVFTDNYPEPVFPAKEAFNFIITPPPRQKYVAVHQNRLFVGDDEYWFWSDPFTPDVFANKATNYIALAKSTGGRHMGGVEFGDQMVMHTEDQTWGLTNVDMDVPTLFPISYGVGSVAPDATATGDGLMIQMGRDGFYSWDGVKALTKISSKMDQTFQKLSYETHGGSKAIIVNRTYKVRFSDPTYTTLGTAWEYSFDSGEWNQISPASFASTLFPLAAIKGPLGTSDYGKMHGIWGKRAYTASETEYGLFLDDLTTQDNGNNYTMSGTMHFPLKPSDALKPNNVVAYYQAADGWGTPSLSYATTNMLKSSPGTINTDTPDTGDDYSIVSGTFSGVAATSDIKVTFSVSSAAGGTPMIQRFFGALLGGVEAKIRRGLRP